MAFRPAQNVEDINSFAFMDLSCSKPDPFQPLLCRHCDLITIILNILLCDTDSQRVSVESLITANKLVYVYCMALLL